MIVGNLNAIFFINQIMLGIVKISHNLVAISIRTANHFIQLALDLVNLDVGLIRLHFGEALILFDLARVLHLLI